MKLNNSICCSLLTLLAMLATFSPASADVHLGQDVLGLATEANESGVFSLSNHPVGNLQLHLMVYGYEYPQGIMAWNCAVVLPEGVLLNKVSLMGEGTNSFTQLGYFNVTTGQPLMPVNGIIHLATLDLITADSLPKELFLAPAPLWGNTGGMEYSRTTDESLRFNFNLPSKCNDCPIFQLINDDVATENQTWDMIKSVFR